MQFACCRFLFTDVLLLLCLNISAQGNTEISGKWKNIDDSSFQVEISVAADGSYIGKVIDSEDAGIDNRAVLSKFIYNPQKKEYLGVLRPPKSSIELVAEIKMISVKELKITAHKFLLTKTMYLTRVQ